MGHGIKKEGKCVTQELRALRCPVCLGGLARRAAKIECSDCGASFTYDNKIPDLRVQRFGYYFNPIPSGRMRAISEALVADNWRQSVREFVRLAPSGDWVDNVAVHGRYSWKLLMELPADGRVLDIGCGLGGLVSNIAPHVSTSCATDLTIERLIFADARFRIFNADDNVRVVASGDGAHLPFADDNFDAIFLSGVLEWVGEGDTKEFNRGSKTGRLLRMLGAHFGETNPRRIQQRFLREIRRILKPDGQLYIGIENRLSHMYFGQRRDHHSTLWFASLMPRFLATLYSITVKRRPYRTYTYSLGGYRRLLAQAGFTATELFGFRDGYSNLRSITPAAGQVERWQPDPPMDWRERISQHPVLVPAYGILARPDARKRPRLLDRLLGKIEQQLDGSMTFGSLEVSRHDKTLIRGQINGQYVLVKLPMSGESEAHEQANANVLQAISARASGLALPLPELLTAGRHQNQAYFVETLIPGAQVSTASGNAAAPEFARALLEALGHDTSDKQATRAVSGDELERLIKPRLSRLAMLLDDPAEASLVQAYFQHTLVGLQLRHGIMHGDLEPGHVLTQSKQITGVVSWHAGAIDGLPAVDAIALATSVLLAGRSKDALPEALEQLATGTVGNEISGLVAQHLPDPATKVEERRSLVYLYWLFHVANRAPFRLQYEPDRIETLVNPIMKAMRERVARAA